MRILFYVVAALSAIYAGYWLLGSSQIEARARAALAGLEAQGWQVDYADLSTQGFPSRFDTTLTEPRLVSPDGRLAWAAPFAQVLALSYSPNRIIAVWPPEQRLTVAGQPMTLRAEGLRASLAAGLSADLPLERATVESGPLAVEGDAGWSVTLDRLLGAIRAAGPATYDLHLDAGGLGSPAVPARLDLARLDGQVVLDAPLDRRLAAPPRLLSLTLREARLARGTVALRASGALAPDAQGFLAGEVRLSIENWRGLLDLLGEAGLLPFDRRAFFERALEQLSEGGPDIEVPVTFADGEVRALGLPLLGAPRL